MFSGCFDPKSPLVPPAAGSCIPGVHFAMRDHRGDGGLVIVSDPAQRAGHATDFHSFSRHVGIAPPHAITTAELRILIGPTLIFAVIAVSFS